MSLADRLPGERRRMSFPRIVAVIWLAAALLALAVVVFLTLERLGVGQQTLTGVFVVISLFTLIVAAALGATVNGPLFFFADRLARAAALGLAGLSAVLTGAFAMTFFAHGMQGRAVLVAGTCAGLLLSLAFLAAPWRTSGASTVPGILAWRTGRARAGWAMLPATVLALLLLAIAEMKTALVFAGILTGWSDDTLLWVVAGLAVIPALSGGWLALLIVNGVAGIWVMVCLLVPAVVGGFAPFLLIANTRGEGFPPLAIAETVTGLDAATRGAAILAFIVIALGTAALPALLVRHSQAKQRYDAQEGVAWIALLFFLAIAALPLSIGRLFSDDDTLRNAGTAFAVLPYLAVFLASYSALAVSLMTLSVTITRGLRRVSGRTPGTAAMFLTRLGAVGLMALIAGAVTVLAVDPVAFWLAGLCMAAGGIFVPLTAALWMRPLPLWSRVLAALLGFFVSALPILAWLMQTLGLSVMQSPLPPIFAAMLAALLSATALWAGQLFAYVRSNERAEAATLILRTPPSDALR